jgi:hypothetical protein
VYIRVVNTGDMKSILSREENSRLIASLKNNNSEAFEEFYDCYAAAFYGSIKRTLLKREVSDETLVEVFNAIRTDVNQLDPQKDRVFIWAFRIVNKIIRKRKVDCLLQEIFACQSITASKVAQPA